MLPANVTHLEVGKSNKDNYLRLIGDEIAHSNNFYVRTVKKYILSVRELIINLDK
jgi:hypothetical protein